LHLLRGLVLAAQQRLGEAEHELTRELSSIVEGQLYARECAANTWYALGALRLRERRHAEADAAFANALSAARGHLASAAALGQPLPTRDAGDVRWLDAELARAVGLSREGRHRDAAHAYRDAVMQSPIPCAGWLLPVEPLIDPASHPDIWADALAIVRQRAM
jgi:tetratricopeptide (TPR) repeat protein